MAGVVIGDLVSEEVRARLDRLPAVLVRLAGRRLPASTRDEWVDEWLAELRYILRGAEAFPITRLIRGTRFAFSLFFRGAPGVRRQELETNWASAGGNVLVAGGGRLLRSLAGVNEDILDQVPSERARYTAVGGAVLSSAGLGALSMAIAVPQVFGDISWLGILISLGWGLLILGVDRVMVAGAGTGSWRDRLKLVLPRLFLAIIVSLVIVEPLVLQIFETKVVQKVHDDRQQVLLAYESQLWACNALPAASVVRTHGMQPADCTSLQVPVATPNPRSLDYQLTRLRRQQSVLKDSARASAAIGNRIKQLKARRATASTVYESAVHASIRNLVEQRRNQALSRRIGLLERINALGELGSGNPSLLVSHWTIALLLILVDCSPIMLMALGSSAYYERLLNINERLLKE